MGDWEDLTEMFGLDASASWDEVAGRMVVHEHEAQSCRASYKPSLYDPVEDSRVENAPALIAAAITAAGGWGPVRVERRSWQADRREQYCYLITIGNQRVSVAVIHPPSASTGWRFCPLWNGGTVQRLFTEQDESAAAEGGLSLAPLGLDRDWLKAVRVLRDAMQVHFGRPGASEERVWTCADYTELEASLRVRIEVDHFPGQTVLHAGRSAGMFGQLSSDNRIRRPEAVVSVRHCFPKSYIERAEGDSSVLAALLQHIAARSLASQS